MGCNDTQGAAGFSLGGGDSEMMPKVLSGHHLCAILSKFLGHSGNRPAEEESVDEDFMAIRP